MKKILLSIALIGTIVIRSKGQESLDMREDFTFGFKAGLNHSNVYDTQGDGFVAGPKWGYTAGIFMAIPIGKFLGFQPEVLYSQRGFKATGSIAGDAYSITRTTSWIDVPLLIQLKLTSFLTIMAGPQYSYLVKQTDVYTSGSTTTQQQQTFDNDNLRKNLLCFTGGADINIQHFVIGGRIGWDLQNNNGDGSSSNPRYKNEWTQLTVGFRF
jgi:hypothetical protein